MATMWINDRSLADFGINIIADPKGWVGPPTAQDHVVTIPGRIGGLRVSGEGSSPSRRFTVEAVLQNPSESVVETLWDQFTQWTSGDELEFKFLKPWPNRVGYGVYEGVSPEDGPLHSMARKFTMSFLMPDPYRYDPQVDVYTMVAGEEVALTLGSAPSDVWLQFVGTGVANPRVVYKDAQGFIRGDLSFGMTFLGGEWIDYNQHRGFQGFVRYQGNPPSTVTSFAVPEFVLTRSFVADPNDGDGTQGPTLTAVNCSIVAYVQKAYR